MQWLDVSTAESRFSTPTLFVRESNESVAFLLRPARIVEEVINATVDLPPGWHEVLPIWLLQEFIAANKAAILLGYSNELNAKFLEFVKRNW